MIIYLFIKCIKRGYLVITDTPATNSCIYYFVIPKDEINMHLVLNESSCGLSETTWSSHFWLPSSLSITRILSYRYKIVDIELGEVFLNPPLHKAIQSSPGIDLTTLKDKLFARIFSFKEISFREKSH